MYFSYTSSVTIYSITNIKKNNERAKKYSKIEMAYNKKVRADDTFKK